MRSTSKKNKEYLIYRIKTSYKQLPATQQIVVKIVALNWEGISQTKLIEAFNNAGFRHENKRLNAGLLRPMLGQLVAAGFLKKNQQSRYVCPNDFADLLCDTYYLDDPDFPKIARYLFKNMPVQYYYHSWHYNYSFETDFKKMRLARYLGKDSIFENVYYRLASDHRSGYSQEELLSYWLPEEWSKETKERVESLPTKILAFLLRDKLIIQLFNFKPANEYFDYTLQLLPTLEEEQRDDLAPYLVDIFFFMGNWEMVEKYKGYIKTSHLLDLINGTQLFAKGQPQEALALFDIATKKFRKETGQKRNYFRNVEGIFHILVRLKLQNETFYRKADAHLNWIAKTPSMYHGRGYEMLHAVRLYLKNDKREARQILRKGVSPTPIYAFFEWFCIYWVDENFVDKKAIQKFQEQLERNQYNWAAMELKALLNAIEPLEENAIAALEQQQQQLGIEPLVNTLPKFDDWEIAVKVLLGLGNSATTAAAAEKDTRLVWLVDFKNNNAYPKLQTFGKKGWTKGRAVTYSRLNQREIPSLTAHDERIIHSVQYGYRSTISFDDASEWKQFVGHPLLFLAKSPEVAVQLVEKQPRLIAREERDGYRLSFSHDISESVGSQIIKESPTRYIFLEITERVAQIARAFNGKTLRVPQKGSDLLKEAITSLAGVMQVESAFEEEDLPTVEADDRACVHLLPVGDGFHVEVYAKPFGDIPPYVKIGSGEPTLIATIDDVRTATNRSLKKERENLKTLRERVPILKTTRPKSGVWELEDTEQCLELLVQLAPLLEEKAIILEWPKGEKFRITSIAGFDQFRMEINEKNNWFEVSGQLAVDEEMVLTMQDLLELSNQKSQFVELSSGKFLALTEEFRKRLKEINGLVATQKDGTLQLHPLATPAIQDFTDSVQFLEADKKFKESQERLKKAYSKKFRVPTKFEATLRPYQKEGYEWLQRCATWGVGACLADDMGLGKTIQALALLVYRAKTGPALVVAPASVCRNWLAETKRFAPTLTPKLFGEGDREKMVKKAKKGDLIIVTYDLMTREGDLFKEKEFGTLILDEAQAIKNRATKRSEVAMELQGDFKMIMTGTPLENHLGELWNLFQFANPGLLGSLNSFSERFAIPIEKYKDANKREQLRKLLQPFILRRKKSEVLKDLPEKTEITLSVPLSPEERAFYEALRRNAVTKIASDNSHGGQKHLKILAEIMKLRRAACHPKLADENAAFVNSAKLELFGEIVQDLLENDHKALVFSQFVGHLKILENYLKEHKIAYQYLDGQTPLAKRQQRIDAFQDGEGDIFLISLKAGGTGLNLTAADFVIHTDPWWNPAVEDQATDRAHRIGQERPVTVYRLVAEGTIEEKILKLHEKKRDLADSLLMGTDVSAKLTADDLLNLISESV